MLHYNNRLQATREVNRRTYRIDKVCKSCNLSQTRMWAMFNVMAALANVGGALCSTPQSLVNTHYYSAVQ